MSDWDALNAYVDGELSPSEAAEIAARIAREPALAQQAATLARMKAAAASVFEQEQSAFELPDILSGPAVGRAAQTAQSRRFVRLAAAAATLLILIALSGYFLMDPRSGGDAPPWLTRAAAVHEELAALAAGSNFELASLEAQAGFQPYVPDLTAARLRPVAATSIPGGTAPVGIAVHFRGTRGCKLSYFAFALPWDGGQLDETLSQLTAGSISGYGWRVGDIGYLLLAEGMDAPRLTVIAVSIQASSRKHQPFDDAAKTRLARSRSNSKACQV